MATEGIELASQIGTGKAQVYDGTSAQSAFKKALTYGVAGAREKKAEQQAKKKEQNDALKSIMDMDLAFWKLQDNEVIADKRDKLVDYGLRQLTANPNWNPNTDKNWLEGFYDIKTTAGMSDESEKIYKFKTEQLFKDADKIANAPDIAENLKEYASKSPFERASHQFIEPVGVPKPEKEYDIFEAVKKRVPATSTSKFYTKDGITYSYLEPDMNDIQESAKRLVQYDPKFRDSFPTEQAAIDFAVGLRQAAINEKSGSRPDESQKGYGGAEQFQGEFYAKKMAQLVSGDPAFYKVSTETEKVGGEPVLTSKATLGNEDFLTGQTFSYYDKDGNQVDNDEAVFIIQSGQGKNLEAEIITGWEFNPKTQKFMVKTNRSKEGREFEPTQIMERVFNHRFGGTGAKYFKAFIDAAGKNGLVDQNYNWKVTKKPTQQTTIPKVNNKLTEGVKAR